MKKMFVLFVAALSAVLVLVLSGCSSTHSTITEYDASGNITKTTESNESVVKEITSSTKDKTIVAWQSGWSAYMSVSAATTEDPTPTAKMFAGKTDQGLISALPNQKNWAGIAKTVTATKYDLEVSTSGLKSASSEDDEK